MEDVLELVKSSLDTSKIPETSSVEMMNLTQTATSSTSQDQGETMDPDDIEFDDTGEGNGVEGDLEMDEE